MYWKYFKYVLEHKKNVFIECKRRAHFHRGKGKINLIIHGLTHDMSKFLPCEFIPYARYDFQNEENNTDKIKADFEKAWEHHYKHNKHHWNYWIGKDMPAIYIRQMICDWSAMSKKFGGTAQEYYLKHYKEFDITRETRFCLEANLGFYVEGCCECDEFYWETIEEIVKDCLKYKKNNPDNFNKKWFYNEYLQEFKNKYKVDLLEVLKAGE